MASACGAHHSFASQSKRRPGMARTASTMSARYGKAKTTERCPCRSGTELDVMRWLHETHGPSTVAAHEAAAR